MGNYLDNHYAAMDGVILSYTGTDHSLTIPKKLANMVVTGLGDGSFMESDDLQEVVIPSGVRTIGKQAFQCCKVLRDVSMPGTVEFRALNAFGGCQRLEDLHLCDVPLSGAGYANLCAASSRVNGSRCLAHSFPALTTVREAVVSTGAAPAIFVQNGISRLFTSQILKEETGAASVTRLLGGFLFSGAEQYTNEAEDFMRLVQTGESRALDRESEEKNDSFLRAEKIPDPEKTAVFTFDDTKTRFQDGRYYITVDVKIGYHFWQSAVPVIVGGRKYYIYRRHYLSSQKDLQYIRRDAAVFSEKGLIRDRREAQTVYAKYKLLSIL